ncbi:MAG: deoxyribose-phosphate aldolase [Saprospiraceae bacterium]
MLQLKLEQKSIFESQYLREQGKIVFEQMSVANLIDHTILKPDCSLKEVQALCKEAANHGFAAVCVPPFYVRESKNYLSDSEVKVATVIGFPMGYSGTAAKVEEIKRAIDDGADELDVVVNICAIKSNNWNYVKNDIDSVTRACHLKGKVIKLIIETSLLSENEIEKVCKVCIDSGVNFVKTSTGFQGGATAEAVSLLRKILPESIKIKASGGIRTKEDAEKMISCGAERIGTSSGVSIVNG